jgi:hypothetical protein
MGYNSRPTESNRTHTLERNYEAHTFKEKPFQKDPETLDGLWILESQHTIMMIIYAAISL